MNYYVALDSETGGLNPRESDMLTLYMGVFDEDFKLMEELDLKLKPDNDRIIVANQGALDVNKINLKEHMENPETITYSKGKELAVAMLKRYLKKRGRYSNLRVLGQNVQFDLDYIQEYLIPKNEWDSIIHYGKIDTKTIVDFFKDANYFPPEIGNLSSIVKYLQIPEREAHNAKADTLMTVDVYKKLLDIMKSKKENGNTTDLISLLEAE